ncbi:hypothetical protein EBQ90_02010, partial [bacterium]|nr:hypothetical protein [bacterium]
MQLSESKYPIRPIQELEPKLRKLVKMAIAVQKKAYAPYSRYSVGCVVVDSRGKIFTGCNVE